MRIAILYNNDFAHLDPGVNRQSEEAVLACVTAVETALRARGAEVRSVPIRYDPVSFAPEFVKDRPDLVVNMCESLAGEARGEMLVPGLLDLLGIPYTGSGPLSLALALHKHKAKELLRSAGVATPAHALVRTPAEVAAVRIPFPLIVKPSREDASIGIDRNSVVRSERELADACARVFDELSQPALVEQYIEGREIYAALLGNPADVLPLTEIDFSRLDPTHPRIVTYACKWDESAPEFHATPSVPCQVEPALQARVAAVARAAFDALDCRDYGRVDLRVSSDGTPYVIEVNPNCDLSPGAGYTRAAQAAGLDYEALVWRLVEIARGRDHANTPALAARSEAARANARSNRRVSGARGRLRTRAG